MHAGPNSGEEASGEAASAEAGDVRTGRGWRAWHKDRAFDRERWHIRHEGSANLTHESERASSRSPDAKLLLSEWRRAGGQQLTSLAEATLRNAARLVGEDPDRLPGTPAKAQRWPAERFLTVGALKEHLTRR